MTFSERVKDRCRQLGITIKELERTAGIANGYIRSTSMQGSRPKPETLEKIATVLKVSPQYLMGEEIEPTGRMIPLLGRVAAGLPLTAVENVIGQEEISEQLASSGEYFALRIQGDSMTPSICDGDIVIVRRQDTAENGDTVVALIDSEDGVCKVFRQTADAIMLISRNPVYDPIIRTDGVQILGKVIELRRML